MRNSLFSDSAKEDIVSRVLQLREDNDRQWGQMEVTGMLHHINKAIKLTLSGKAKPKKPTMKQWLSKNAFLHVFRRFPKNVATRSDLDVVGSRLEANSFEEERTELLRLLNQFQRATEIHAMHPYFGYLNLKEWGIFTWMHIDHHLRQFGV